jgi:hypothetical protein
MGISSRPPNKNWDEHWDQTFRGQATPSVSKYKAEWKPYSKNEEFWAEVLVGRKIVDIKFDETHLCAIKLDSGEVVKIINNENGKGVLCVED